MIAFLTSLLDWFRPKLPTGNLLGHVDGYPQFIRINDTWYMEAFYQVWGSDIDQIYDWWWINPVELPDRATYKPLPDDVLARFMADKLLDRVME